MGFFLIFLFICLFFLGGGGFGGEVGPQRRILIRTSAKMCTVPVFIVAAAWSLKRTNERKQYKGSHLVGILSPVNHYGLPQG